jgi:type I restriction enzyme M protein
MLRFAVKMAKRHANSVGNLESLFIRLEELVLANSGENEFDEIFKLIIAKLWDEKAHGSKRFHTYPTDDETFAAISSLLREAARNWPGILDSFEKPLLTPPHLSICVEALTKHRILSNSLDVVDNFFEFIVSRTAKGSKGQFFTPRYVIELCVRMLNPQKWETVLDPACGSGGFLFHTLQYVRRSERLGPSDVKSYCEQHLWGFDIDIRATKIAKALMILAGDGHSNIIRVNSLVLPSITPNLWDTSETSESFLTIEDVARLRIRRHKGFDIILTNPPFAGEIKERKLLDNYVTAKGKLRVERDVLFIERCVRLLRPGGRLAIVLPNNKFGGESFSYVREWLAKKLRIVGVVSLARETFLPHTHQKACILIGQKRTSKAFGSDENIFFAVSEKAGKNSKGQLMWTTMPNTGELWESVDHDLKEVETNFLEFRKQEKITFDEDHGSIFNQVSK